MWNKRRIATFLIMMLLVMMFAPMASVASELTVPTENKHDENKEYIVKWLYTPILEGDGFKVLEHDIKLKVSLIRIYSPYANDMLERLQRDPNVEYIEKKVYYSIHADTTTFDTNLQYYLDITRLREVQELVTINTNLTIAVLDTGVDLTHPDLVGNLVPGINLIDSKKAPQDDQGHGTMVAGIIASTGKNRTGYEGILPDINIMPIKVMSSDGRGDSLKVSQGIRYAVDNGADIISLSLADFIASKKVAEEVAYAEEKGVLIVAVTGNGGYRVGYPAAFPTVLAVGAVDQFDRYASYSNYGSQVDVVAPGSRIYAPQLGGGYASSTGTSMAGPQVVGLAAMIMSKYPDYTPAQIRNLIRYSAIEVGTKGWNERTGYGRIDALNALFLPLPDDIYEPNDTATTAKVAPLGKQVDAKLSTSTDKDWYTVTVPYDGKLKIEWKRPTTSRIQTIKVTIYDPQMVEIRSFSSRLNGSTEVNVRKGQYMVKVEAVGSLDVGGLNYSLISSFTIYDDPYGANHRPDSAYVVPLSQGKLVGTLNKDNQEDWFTFVLPLDGKFKYTVYTDTFSIDPVVTIIRANGQRTVVDKTGFQSGNVEQGEIDVKAGNLRIGVRNFYELATNGEYTIEWEYKPEIVDLNEPNNSIFAATDIKLNQPVYGYIASIADYDYFKITITEPGLYQVEGSNFPKSVLPNMAIYDALYQRVTNVSLNATETAFKHQTWLEKGTFYIRIDARAKFDNQLYMLNVSKINSAFKDLGNNWAQSSINRLAGLGIISGYEDKTFRPNNSISRAEFVHLLVKTLGIKAKNSNEILPFTDVKANFWAKDSLLIAYQHGLITGYDDKTIRPEAMISRSEMVSILARGLQIKPIANSNQIKPNGQLAVQKFVDINRTSWYTDALSILLQLNLINGFEDGSFKPTANTSRAEVATMLERIWFHK